MSTNITAGYSAGRPEQVGEDGTFRLTGVRGRVLMIASGGAAVLKAIRHAGQDLATIAVGETATVNLRVTR